MKVAVMGAGAVGCHFGGLVARAGHDVVLIGRPQHVEAIERQGLRLETKTFDERVRDNVRGTLWAKLILNCAYNALSAIAQLPYGRLVQGEGMTAVMHDLVDECVAVARADGVTIPGDVDAAVRCQPLTVRPPKIE